MLSKQIFKADENLLEAMGFDLAFAQKDYKNKTPLPKIDLCSDKLARMLLLFSANTNPNSYQQKALRLFAKALFKQEIPATHRVSPEEVTEWGRDSLFVKYCRSENQLSQASASQVDSVLRGIIVRRHALRQRVVFQQMVRNLFANIQHFESVALRTTDANPLEYYIQPCPPLPVPLFAIAPVTDEKSFEALPIGGCVVVNTSGPATSPNILDMFWGRDVNLDNYTFYFKAGQNAYAHLVCNSDTTRVDFVALRTSLLANTANAKKIAYYQVKQMFEDPSHVYNGAELWQHLTGREIKLYQIKLVHEYGIDIFARHDKPKKQYRDGEEVFVCTTSGRIKAEKGDMVGVASTREAVYEELRGFSTSSYSQADALARIEATKTILGEEKSKHYAWIIQDIQNNHAAYHRADFDYAVNLWSQLAQAKEDDGGILEKSHLMLKQAAQIARSGVRKPGGQETMIVDMLQGFQLFKDSRTKRHNFEISRPAKMIAFLESLIRFQNESASYIFLGLRIRNIMQRLGPGKLQIFNQYFSLSSSPPPRFSAPGRSGAKPTPKPKEPRQAAIVNTRQVAGGPTLPRLIEPARQSIPKTSAFVRPTVVDSKQQIQIQASQSQVDNKMTVSLSDMPTPKELYASPNPQTISVLKALLQYAKTILAGIQSVTLSPVSPENYINDEYTLSSAILYSHDALVTIEAKGVEANLPMQWLLLVDKVKDILSNTEYVLYASKRTLAFPRRTLGVILIQPHDKSSQLMKINWNFAVETLKTTVIDLFRQNELRTKFLECPAFALLAFPEKYYVCFDRKVYYRDILLIPMFGLDFSGLVRLLAPGVFSDNLVMAIHALEPPPNWTTNAARPYRDFWDTQHQTLIMITQETAIFNVERYNLLPPESQSILNRFHTTLAQRLAPYQQLVQNLNTVSINYGNQSYRQKLLADMINLAMSTDRDTSKLEFDLDMVYQPFVKTESWAESYDGGSITHKASAALSHAILTQSVSNIIKMFSNENIWQYMVKLHKHASELLSLLQTAIGGNVDLLSRHLQDSGSQWAWLQMIPASISQAEMYSSNVETEKQTKISDLPLKFTAFEDGTFTAEYNMATNQITTTADATKQAAIPTAVEFKQYISQKGHLYDEIVKKAPQEYLYAHNRVIEYFRVQSAQIAKETVTGQIYMLEQGLGDACLLYAMKYLPELVHPNEIASLDDEVVERGLSPVYETPGQAFDGKTLQPYTPNYRYFPRPQALLTSSGNYKNHITRIITDLESKLSTSQELFPNLVGWCRTLLQADRKLITIVTDGTQNTWSIVDNIIVWLLADPQSLTLQMTAELLGMKNPFRDLDMLSVRLKARVSPNTMGDCATQDYLTDYQSYYEMTFTLASDLTEHFKKLATDTPKECPHPSECALLMTQSFLVLQKATAQQNATRKIADEAASGSGSLLSMPSTWPLSRPFRRITLNETGALLEEIYKNQYLPMLPDAVFEPLLNNTTYGSKSAFTVKIPTQQYTRLHGKLGSRTAGAILQRWMDEKNKLINELRNSKTDSEMFFWAIALYRAILHIHDLQSQSRGRNPSEENDLTILLLSIGQVFFEIRQVSVLRCVLLIVTDHLLSRVPTDVTKWYQGVVEYAATTMYNKEQALLVAQEWRVLILDEKYATRITPNSVSFDGIDSSDMVAELKPHFEEQNLIYAIAHVSNLASLLTESTFDRFSTYTLLCSCNYLIRKSTNRNWVEKILRDKFSTKFTQSGEQNYTQSFAFVYFSNTIEATSLVEYFTQNFLGDDFFVDGGTIYKAISTTESMAVDQDGLDLVNDIHTIITETENGGAMSDDDDGESESEATLVAFVELIHFLVNNYERGKTEPLNDDFAQDDLGNGIDANRMSQRGYKLALGAGFSLESQFGPSSPSKKDLLWAVRNFYATMKAYQTETETLYKCSVNLVFYATLIAMKAFARTKNFELLYRLATGYQRVVFSWKPENIENTHLYSTSGKALGACSFETISVLRGLQDFRDNLHKVYATTILDSIDPGNCWHIPPRLMLGNTPLSVLYRRNGLSYKGIPHALMSMKTVFNWTEIKDKIPHFSLFVNSTKAACDSDQASTVPVVNNFKDRFRVLFCNFEKLSITAAIDNLNFEFYRQYLLLYLEILIARLDNSNGSDTSQDKEYIKWWVDNIKFRGNLANYNIESLLNKTIPADLQKATIDITKIITEEITSAVRDSRDWYQNDLQKGVDVQVVDDLSKEAKTMLTACFEANFEQLEFVNYLKHGYDFYDNDQWGQSNVGYKLVVVHECAKYYITILENLVGNNNNFTNLHSLLEIVAAIQGYFQQLLDHLAEDTNEFLLVEEEGVTCIRDNAGDYKYVVDVGMVWRNSSNTGIQAYREVDLIKTYLKTKVGYVKRMIERNSVLDSVDAYGPLVDGIEFMVGQATPNYENKVFSGFYSFLSEWYKAPTNEASQNKDKTKELMISKEQVQKIMEFAKNYYLEIYKDLFSEDYNRESAALRAMKSFYEENKSDNLLVSTTLWAVVKSNQEELPTLVDGTTDLHISEGQPSIVESESIGKMLDIINSELGGGSSKNFLHVDMMRQYSLVILGPINRFVDSGADIRHSFVLANTLRHCATTKDRGEIHQSYQDVDPQFEFDRFSKILDWIILYLAQEDHSINYDLVHAVGLWYDNLVDKSNKKTKTYELASLYPDKDARLFSAAGEDLKLELLSRAMLLKDRASTIKYALGKGRDAIVANLITSVKTNFSDPFFLIQDDGKSTIEHIRNANDSKSMKKLALHADTSAVVQTFINQPTLDNYLQVLTNDDIGIDEKFTFACVGASIISNESTVGKFVYVMPGETGNFAVDQRSAIDATISLLNSQTVSQPPKMKKMAQHHSDFASVIHDFENEGRRGIQKKLFKYTAVYDVLVNEIDEQDEYTALLGRYWSDLPSKDQLFDSEQLKQILQIILRVQPDPTTHRTPILTFFEQEMGRRKVRDAYVEIFQHALRGAQGDRMLFEVCQFIMCACRWFERSRDAYGNANDQITLAPILYVVHRFYKNVLGERKFEIYKAPQQLLENLNLAVELIRLLDSKDQASNVFSGVRLFLTNLEISPPEDTLRREVLGVELALNCYSVLYHPLSLSSYDQHPNKLASVAWKYLFAKNSTLPRRVFEYLLNLARTKATTYFLDKYDNLATISTSQQLQLPDIRWRSWCQLAWRATVNKSVGVDTKKELAAIEKLLEGTTIDPLQTFLVSTYTKTPVFNSGTLQARWIGCDTSALDKLIKVELQIPITRSDLWCIKEKLYTVYESLLDNKLGYILLWYPDQDDYEPANCVSYDLRSTTQDINNDLLNFEKEFSMEFVQKLISQIKLYENKRSPGESFQFASSTFDLYGPDLSRLLDRYPLGMIFQAYAHTRIRGLRMAHPHANPRYPYKNPPLPYVKSLQMLCLQYCLKICESNSLTNLVKWTEVANVLSCVNSMCNFLHPDLSGASLSKYYVQARPYPTRLLLELQKDEYYKVTAPEQTQAQNMVVDIEDLKNILTFFKEQFTNTSAKKTFPLSPLLSKFEARPAKTESRARSPNLPSVLTKFKDQEDVKACIATLPKDSYDDEIVWHVLLCLYNSPKNNQSLTPILRDLNQGEAALIFYDLPTSLGTNKKRAIRQLMMDATRCAHTTLSRVVGQAPVLSPSHLEVVGLPDHIIVHKFEKILRALDITTTDVAELPECSGQICGGVFDYSKNWPHACQRLLLEHMVPASIFLAQKHILEYGNSAKKLGDFFPFVLDNAWFENFFVFVLDLRRQANNAIENRDVLEAMIDIGKHANKILEQCEEDPNLDKSTSALKKLSKLGSEREAWIDYDALDLLSKKVCLAIQQEAMEDDRMKDVEQNAIEADTFEAPVVGDLTSVKPIVSDRFKEFQILTNDVSENIKGISEKLVKIHSLVTDAVDATTMQYLARSWDGLVWQASRLIRKNTNTKMQAYNQAKKRANFDFSQIIAENNWYAAVTSDSARLHKKLPILPLWDVRVPQIDTTNRDFLTATMRIFYDQYPYVFYANPQNTTTQRHESISKLLDLYKTRNDHNVGNDKVEWNPESYNINTLWRLGMLPSTGVAHAVGCAVQEGINKIASADLSCSLKGWVGATLVALVYLSAKRMSILPVTSHIVQILEKLTQATTQNTLVETYETAVERANVPIFDGCSYCSLRLFGETVSSTETPQNFMSRKVVKHKVFWGAFAQVYDECKKKDDPVAAEVGILAVKWSDASKEVTKDTKKKKSKK